MNNEITITAQENRKINNLSEKYFSDILSKLLKIPDFKKRFLKKIYGEEKRKYKLTNSNVFKEYTICNNKNKSTKNIDLLFIDLDPQDDIVIGIENKFLTDDSKNKDGLHQLDNYKGMLIEQFSDIVEDQNRIKLIYLTLTGIAPLHSKDKEIICLSWISDIYGIIQNKIDYTSKYLKKEVQELNKRLEIINKINKSYNREIETSKIGNFSNDLLSFINQRSNSHKQWKITDKKDTRKSITIGRTKQIKIKLSITLDTIILEHTMGPFIKHFIPRESHPKQAEYLTKIFCAKVLKQTIINFDKVEFHTLNMLLDKDNVMYKKMYRYLKLNEKDSLNE